MSLSRFPLALVISASVWASSPPGFETHYVDVGSGRGTIAVTASPVDGSIFVIADGRVIKTDAKGNMVTIFEYAFGGATAAAVDSQGNLVMAGEVVIGTNFPATVQPAPNLAGAAAYVVKFDPNLTRITDAVLFGGSTGVNKTFPSARPTGLTTDKAGNIYVTGITDLTDFPTTSGAYLTSIPAINESLPAGYSFVTKFSPDLSTLLYSTYFGNESTGGTFSASTYMNSIIVDSRGAATIGGSSNVGTLNHSGAFPPGRYPFVARFSPSGASLEAYTDFGKRWVYGLSQGVFAVALDGSGNTWAAGMWLDAGATGVGAYVAKLDASFKLLIGEFIGGASKTNVAYETTSGLQIDPQGNIWITGLFDPGNLSGQGMAQSFGNPQPYVATFSSDGSPLGLLETPAGGLGMAQCPGGELIVLGSPDSFLLSNSMAAAGPFIVTSSANNVSSGTVAPGELVSLYGSGVGPAVELGGVVVNGVFANKVGGYQVLFNDVPAPLLYLGPNQINTVVPEALAFLTTTAVSAPMATLKIVGPNGIMQLPSVFVAPSRPQIFGASRLDAPPYYPPTLFVSTALNEDGTANSATNRAVTGSIVTIWASGLGYEDAVDGSIIQQPTGNWPVSVISSGAPLDVLYASDAPGAVLGLTQINFRAPVSGTFAIQTSSGISDTASIWVTAH